MKSSNSNTKIPIATKIFLESISLRHFSQRALLAVSHCRIRPLNPEMTEIFPKMFVFEQEFDVSCLGNLSNLTPVESDWRHEFTEKYCHFVTHGEGDLCYESLEIGAGVFRTVGLHVSEAILALCSYEGWLFLCSVPVEKFQDACRSIIALFLLTRGTKRAKTLPVVSGDVCHDGCLNHLRGPHRHDLCRRDDFACACCYEPLPSSDSFRRISSVPSNACHSFFHGIFGLVG